MFDSDFELALAVGGGNLRRVDELLAAGASINGTDDGDIKPTKPLLLAAEVGQVGVLQLLVNRGADLEVAVVREVLNDDGVAVFPNGSRALHAAVIGRQPASARFLLKAGCKPDVVDSTGMTPLMLAHDSAPVVRELLLGGANPTFAGGNGVIALHMCALNDSSEEVMDLLLEAAPSSVNQVTSPPQL